MRRHHPVKGDARLTAARRERTPMSPGWCLNTQSQYSCRPTEIIPRQLPNQQLKRSAAGRLSAAGRAVGARNDETARSQWQRLARPLRRPRLAEWRHRRGSWSRALDRGRCGAIAESRGPLDCRSLGFDGIEHRGICFLGTLRCRAFSRHGQPGLHRAGDDRLQYCDPSVQCCCALALHRLAQSACLFDGWRSRRARRRLSAPASSDQRLSRCHR